MISGAHAAAAWLRRLAEHVAVALLAVMFLAFMCQIVFRYVFGWPTGWAFELSMICWLYVVLWGAAFVVREADEIRFDIVYSLLPAGVRRLGAALAGLVLILLYGLSFPAVIDYVAFLKVERTTYLRIRFDWLYAIFPVFALAVIARYAWLVRRGLLGGKATAPDQAGQ